MSTHKVVGTFGDTTQVTEEDKKFYVTPSDDSTKPQVVLFGWAGASPKNLAKYGELYSEIGCPTVQYILPTRFIFRHTEQAFEAVADVLDQIDPGRKTVVHCLSDTGVLSFQGLSIAASFAGSDFKPAGIIWDSCPGPRPHVTMPRMVVLTAINWLARMRDGMTLSQAITSSYIDFRDLGLKNFARRMQGLETKISCMEEVWAGYWARDLKSDVPELFIHSESDYYVSAKYIESDVLPHRRQNAKEVTVCKFGKSPHVGHLRVHKDVYTRHVQQLVDKVHAS